MFSFSNAEVSSTRSGAIDRAKMAKPCASRHGVLSVRMRSKATNDLTASLCASLLHHVALVMGFKHHGCDKEQHKHNMYRSIPLTRQQIFQAHEIS